MLWLLPARAKKALNADGLLRYDHGTSRWR